MIIAPYIVLFLAYQQDLIDFQKNHRQVSSAPTASSSSVSLVRHYQCEPLRKGLSPISNEAGHCSSYFTDGKAVFFLGEEKIVTENVDSFRAIGDSVSYATDGKNVFHNGYVIRGADPKTFTILMNLNGEDTSFSADKNGLFYETIQYEGFSLPWPQGYNMQKFWRFKYGTTTDPDQIPEGS